MKHNKCLCFLVLLLIGNSLFAISRPHVTFDIRNFSSYDVIVNMEFWRTSENDLDSAEMLSRWVQTISDVPVLIEVSPILLRNNVIQPGQQVSIIRYSTSFLQIDKIISMPFINRMKETFRRMEIIHDGGRRVITLESLEEIEIIEHISGWEAWYVLEIFDW